MNPNPNDEALFTSAQDTEAMQAIVLAAAIQGDEGCRAQLRRLHPSFEEPYRTVASLALEQMQAGSYLDRVTLCAALDGTKLARRNANGKMEELTPPQAVNLIFACDVRPGQACAYLQILNDQLTTNRRRELKERAQELAGEFGENPSRLLGEFERLVAEGRRPDAAGSSSHLPEALEFFPYFSSLEDIQKGTEFLGLDSGFPILNQICNGLDTGLFIIAAKPSEGKTTHVWQICQQVARINQVPVIFVSMEQSKRELRAKALARLSRINSRHIARGRLRSDDPSDLARLRQAGADYFAVARYLTIIEGDDTTSIEAIRDLAKVKMAAVGAERCLIAVDYLQILPLDRADAGRVTSTKDRVDLHVSALRRMARELDSPVIAISSENRAGYNSKELNVFKESGGIEYSADIAAIMAQDTKAPRSASDTFRAVNLYIVKNRSGETGAVKFKFYPERAEFVETGRGVLPVNEEA